MSFSPMPMAVDRGSKSEDWRLYEQQLHESEGFDVDDCPVKGRTSSTIAPIDCEQRHVEYLLYAIEDKNGIRKRAGLPPISLVMVLKVNRQTFPPRLFFTFVGKDLPDGAERTYQARVPTLYPELAATVFRVKPPPVVQVDELGWEIGGPSPPAACPNLFTPAAIAERASRFKLAFGFYPPTRPSPLRETPSASHQK